MDESPLVSIIIPTYNNGPVVGDAIDCALNQTYRSREIIVVDDGSTDGTENLLKSRYGDKIIFVRQENKGPGSARNTGIRHATGEYVQFLDADDLLDRDKIDLQVSALLNITGKAVSYSNYAVRDMNNKPLNYTHVNPRLQDDTPFEDIMMKWETGLCIPIHCFIFSMAFFRDHGIAFDETLRANEDWECWMNIFALRPEVIFVDLPLALYRVRENSRCRNRLNMRNSYLKALDMQIMKNASNGAVAEQLVIRRKQIKCLYRDEGPLVRKLAKFHPAIKNIYMDLVPWRIQRLFD